MDNNAKWIWLDKDKYPDCQKSEITYFDKRRKKNKFVAAEFIFSKRFDKRIEKATVCISADVKYWLKVNGDFVGVGPVCAGGDYAEMRPELAMPVQYYNTYEIEIKSNTIDFYVLVQKNIVVMCETSQGNPGLILSAKLIFDDGTEEVIVSDERWKARKNNQRCACGKTDYTVCDDEWSGAKEIQNIWNLQKSPIKLLDETEIMPLDFSEIRVKPKEIKSVILEFDKIYSCYYHMVVNSGNEYLIQIEDYEKEPEKSYVMETVLAKKPVDFRSMRMTSAGTAKLYIINTGSEELVISKFAAIFTHYPVLCEGTFECSEQVLNKAYNMGKWALKICKQTIELDSPKHQENLGCTGDYYIASLMNYFTYGDASLTRFDLIRIANYLTVSDGFMYHTTYSMIWILMLYDYYKFTDDRDIFKETKTALSVLLERFDGYTDERGIIVNPDSYMFVDWLVVDGISLHHPPAALGQAVLNAFYYGGLKTAVKIYSVINEKNLAKDCKQKAEKLKKAFNRYFYDDKKGLYFDGLNEKYEVRSMISENISKRYYSWHTNSLAVLFDIAPNNIQRRIMETILNDMSLINPQPYFMHFILEAIFKTDLFEEYGINQLMRWEDMTKFGKGLQEGWYDCSGYGFDYSHVWGGTPTYQLPSKLLGFEMTEPGYKKITLYPRLFGLSYAKIKIPTPYGCIEAVLERGKEPAIKVPDGIEYEIK